MRACWASAAVLGECGRCRRLSVQQRATARGRRCADEGGTDDDADARERSAGAADAGGWAEERKKD